MRGNRVFERGPNPMHRACTTQLGPAHRDGRIGPRIHPSILGGRRAMDFPRHCQHLGAPIVHEGVPLDALTSYRVLAVGGEGQIAASNLVDITFVYLATHTPDHSGGERPRPRSGEDSLGNRHRDLGEQRLRISGVERSRQPVDSARRHLRRHGRAIGGARDQGLNTDENRYRYRALCYNACGVMIGTSQAVETILLRAYQSTEPGLYETAFGNLMDSWTASMVTWWRKAILRRGGAVRIFDLDSRKLREPRGRRQRRIRQPWHLLLPRGRWKWPTATSCRRVQIQRGLPDGRADCVDSAFSPNGDQINDWFPWPPGEANVGFLGNPQNSPTSK